MSPLQFSITKFPNDATSFICPTWNELQLLTFELATTILSAGVQVDRVVTLAKGGWPMTRSLVDFLQIPHVASIGVKFYTDIDTKLDKPVIYQELPISVRGESVLLFDDVADSGGSLLFVKEHLLAQGVKQVTTATQLYKPHSKLKPDYFGQETTSWVIFPYEVFDSMNLLEQRWQKQGCSAAEIRERLVTLGFAPAYIEQFLRH